MKICVYGLWHLGCVISSCLADKEFNVVGLDPDELIIKNLLKAKPPLFEPGLEELISKNLKKNLNFTSNYKEAIGDADILWIAFDTPVDKNDKADTEYIFEKIRDALKFVNDNCKIIISSQVPVGFVKKLEIFTEKEYKKKLYFCYSPENLRLGKSIHYFKNPDRIIVGIRDEKHKKLLKSFFEKLSDNIVWMNIESAEMTKHAINSFLALSITFVNEIAALCEFNGADEKEVEAGLKTDERIGQKAYLKPGIAYSGGTLARDVNFLNSLADSFNYPAYLLSGIKKSNNYHKKWLKRTLLSCFRSLEGKTVTILGLTYKSGTSTLRRSIAVEFINSLKSESVNIRVFDPEVKELPDNLKNIITLCGNLNNALNNSDCLVIITEKQIFRQELSLEIINKMKNKLIIDANGFIENIIKEDKSIKYIRVGKKSA